MKQIQQPSEAFVERVQEALLVLKQLTSEDVLTGRRQGMSLRLFTSTFDISRTSIKQYPQIHKQILSAIAEWNNEFAPEIIPKRNVEKRNQYNLRQKENQALKKELELAQNAQFEAWQERTQLEKELRDTQAELERLKLVGRFPAVVEGFSSRYAKLVPLWFQFEVLRLYSSEHESIMCRVEEYKSLYASALPGGVDGFYPLLVRSEPTFSGKSLLAVMQQVEAVERFLKARCM